MPRKFSASFKITGRTEKGSTDYLLGGKLNEAHAVDIAAPFFKVFRKDIEERYPEHTENPQPKRLVITINFP